MTTHLSIPLLLCIVRHIAIELSRVSFCYYLFCYYLLTRDNYPPSEGSFPGSKGKLRCRVVFRVVFRVVVLLCGLPAQGSGSKQKELPTRIAIVVAITLHETRDQRPWRHSSSSFSMGF
jgi:hypothetical protein